MSEEYRTNPMKRGRWTKDELKLFKLAFQWYGKDWRKLSEVIQTRTIIQIRSHAQKFEKKMQKLKQEEGTCSKLYIIPSALEDLNQYVTNTVSNSYKVYVECETRLMYSQGYVQGLDSKMVFEGAKGEVDSS